MYKGKRLDEKNRRRWSKHTAALVSLLLILSISIGGTVALIVVDGGFIKNIFTRSEVTTYVQETINGNQKTNVMIQNTGDIKAYIRAAVVVTWQDENGNVLGEKPVEGTDYTITYNLSSQQGAERWIRGADGFFYWTSPVKSDDEDSGNCTTDILISNCEALRSRTVNTGEGAVTYSLTVEIIGSGIQSVPTSVVTDKWSSGVSGVSGDVLTVTQ